MNFLPFETSNTFPVFHVVRYLLLTRSLLVLFLDFHRELVQDPARHQNRTEFLQQLNGSLRKNAGAQDVVSRGYCRHLIPERTRVGARTLRSPSINDPGEFCHSRSTAKRTTMRMVQAITSVSLTCDSQGEG